MGKLRDGMTGRPVATEFCAGQQLNVASRLGGSGNRWMQQGETCYDNPALIAEAFGVPVHSIAVPSPELIASNTLRSSAVNAS